MVETVYFSLNIPKDQLLLWYRGAARDLQVRASDGRLIKLPIKYLQPFVTPEGIVGHFQLKFLQSKFIDLKKIS